MLPTFSVAGAFGAGDEPKAALPDENRDEISFRHASQTLSPYVHRDRRPGRDGTAQRSKSSKVRADYRASTWVATPLPPPNISRSITCDEPAHRTHSGLAPRSDRAHRGSDRPSGSLVSPSHTLALRAFVPSGASRGRFLTHPGSASDTQ